jgi:glyoxylase-like metal-dependent hydrolase (beta-lactamase superfamily II)
MEYSLDIEYNNDDEIDSVKKKIFTLEKEYKILCGHGPETAVGYEMETNPFF